MPYTLHRQNKADAPSFSQLYFPVHGAMPGMAPLKSRGDRPLKMTFEDQLKALIFFHLEEHTSERHLLQVLEEDDFARDVMPPKEESKKVVLQRLLIPEDLNSLLIYTKTCKPRPSGSCQKDIMSLETSLASTVP